MSARGTTGPPYIRASTVKTDSYPLGRELIPCEAGGVHYTLVLGATSRDALRDALRSRGVRTNPYFDVLWPHVTFAAEPPAVICLRATRIDEMLRVRA